MKCIRLMLVLLGAALPLAGCVVAPAPYYAGGGWCYYHPYRCH